MAQDRSSTRERSGSGRGFFGDLVADLRQSFRQLLRHPGFALLGILTLALGLGATVGLASVVRAVLVRPLPVAREAQLRVFWGDYDWRGVEFDFLKEQTKAFAGSLAAYSVDASTLRRDQGSAVLLTGMVSSELFNVLGTAPAMGRAFAAGEDRPGSEPVAVLSWGLWQQELGADPGIVGRRVILDGSPVTVIGVMPRNFFFPTPEVRLWRPLNLDPASGQYQGNGWLVLIGRLKDGTSQALVDQDVAAMAKALGERFTYPAAWDLSKGAYVRPLRQYLVGDVRPALLLLLGAGVLLLLMACANVAALVLARTTDRTHEITLRSALGAGRGRLARQIITESLSFSIIGGGVGLGVAILGFQALVASLPLKNGLSAAISLDWTAFAVALVLAVVVGLLVAAAPVRDLLAGRLSGLASERGVRGLARGTSRVHSTLVGGEAAVAVLLTVGAVLLIRSVNHLLALDLGFEPKGVVAVDVVASGSDISPADQRRIFRELTDRAATIPGVSSVGIVPRLPLRDGGWQGVVGVDGRPDLEGNSAPNSLYRPITPDYFRTMGMRVIRGRGIEAGDRPGTVRVGLVNQSFADKAWPNADPIGRLLHTRVGADTGAITVVGVVADAKLNSVAGATPFVLYLARDQESQPFEGGAFVLKSSADQASVVAAMRSLVREIDPRAAVARVTSMDDVVTTTLAEPLRLRFFLTLFAGVALALGVVGIYSVVSYSVSRRQTEFGVRMALGAAPTEVLRQVVGRGLLPVAIGTAIGLVAALGLARVAVGFLYGVSPADPLSVVTAAAMLLASGFAAAAVPALRASRVSPVESLRSD